MTLTKEQLEAYCDMVRERRTFTTEIYCDMLDSMADAVTEKLAHPCSCGAPSEMYDHRNICRVCRKSNDYIAYQKIKAASIAKKEIE